MDQSETIALFERAEGARTQLFADALSQGKSEEEARRIGHEGAKSVWNGWAETMLAERNGLETAGHWVVQKDLLEYFRPGNERTRCWMEAAKADFSNLRFELTGRAIVSKRYASDADLQPCTAPSARVLISHLPVDFSGFVFPGDAVFLATQFCTDARFEGSLFQGEAWFREAQFLGSAVFWAARFCGNARFKEVVFRGPAFFENAQFGEAALYEQTQFHGAAVFKGTRFSGSAWFSQDRFAGAVLFNKAHFCGDAKFRDAQFAKRAWFEKVLFGGNISFDGAVFWDTANFTLAEFEQYASFNSTHFHDTTNFYAIRSQRAFAMADATFEMVPDFIQAHFEEAPRLDDIIVRGRMIKPSAGDRTRRSLVAPRDMRISSVVGLSAVPLSFLDLDGLRHWLGSVYERMTNANRDIPARWHALKRIAIKAHDQDREREFFAHEIRAARFVDDWPVPLRIWEAKAWFGFFRFWFGVLYGIFSSYGRSVLSPALWWIAAITLSAIFYLGENDAIRLKRNAMAASGAGLAERYAATTYDAWRGGAQCFSPTPADNEIMTKVSVVGLSDALLSQTNATTEAFHLALSNAFLVLSSGENAATRIYGCLYGIELYAGGRPVPIVPPSVSAASAIQKLFSVVMIFLFGFALRNMLKMK